MLDRMKDAVRLLVIGKLKLRALEKEGLPNPFNLTIRPRRRGAHWRS